MVCMGENILRFDAKFTMSNLKLTLSDDEQFHIITKKRKLYWIEGNGKELCIRQKRKNFFYWLFHWIPIKIEIKLPKGYKGSVKINNKNGATLISKINTDELDIENHNGKIEFNDIKTKFLRADIRNGKVALNDIKVDNLEIKSNNGKIEFNNIDVKYGIKAKSANGKVLVKNAEIETAEIYSSNGRIELDGVTVNDLKAFASNGRIAALLNGLASDYCVDLTTKNGTAYIAGKKFRGGYVYKDKDKDKHIEANTKNGSIKFSFLNA